MTDRLTLTEAAAYLGLTRRGIRYHVYTARDLVPDENVNGKMLFFNRETLDEFQSRRRPGGRPTRPVSPDV